MFPIHDSTAPYPNTPQQPCLPSEVHSPNSIDISLKWVSSAQDPTAPPLSHDSTAPHPLKSILLIPEGYVSVDYSVKKDDSLLGIADRFNSRVSDIRNWNNIPYTTTIRVGQKLKIYVPKENQDYFTSIDKTSKIEEKAILVTLESANGNKSEAARRLGITRKTLLKKLKQYGKV